MVLLTNKKKCGLFLFVMICVAGCDSGQKHIEYYNATIKDVVSHHLFLSNNKEVRLVGVYIPFSEDENYKPKLQERITELLRGKDVQIKTIVRGKKVKYPKIDLVEVHLDGVNINKQLLKSGSAFFFEDYWDVQDKEHYRRLEKVAREGKVGLWGDMMNLRVIAVRNIGWQYVYHPECVEHEVENSKNFIKYYVPLPFAKEGIMRDTILECNIKKWGFADDEEFQKVTKTGWQQLEEYFDKKSQK